MPISSIWVSATLLLYARAFRFNDIKEGIQGGHLRRAFKEGVVAQTGRDEKSQSAEIEKSRAEVAGRSRLDNETELAELKEESSTTEEASFRLRGSVSGGGGSSLPPSSLYLVKEANSTGCNAGDQHMMQCGANPYVQDHDLGSYPGVGSCVQAYMISNEIKLPPYVDQIYRHGKLVPTKTIVWCLKPDKHLYTSSWFAWTSRRYWSLKFADESKDRNCLVFHYAPTYKTLATTVESRKIYLLVYVYDGFNLVDKSVFRAENLANQTKNMVSCH